MHAPDADNTAPSPGPNHGQQSDRAPGPNRRTEAVDARLPVPAGASGVLLFGGTFDPPHIAHLELGLLARDRVLGPDAWLVVVPAARSPHKDSGPLASDEDRIAMLQLAKGDAENVGVWTFEIDRGRVSSEPSYWVRTIEHARSCLPSETPLRFLIGADQAVSFHRWRSFREILAMASPIVMLRPPTDTIAKLTVALEAAGVWTASERAWWREQVADLPVVDVSATDVRASLASGLRKGKEKLHPKVEHYIRSHGLYGTDRAG